MLVASVAATTLVASLAHANDAFGPENAISIRSSVPLLSFVHTKPGAGDAINEFAIGPKMTLTSFAVDYWITKDVTLGGALQYGSRSAAPESWSMSLAPSLGYRYAMGDITLWPKIQPYYNYTSTTVATVESTTSRVGIGVELPFLYSRGSFFYGPVVAAQFDVSSTTKTGGNSSDGPMDTIVGAGFQLGSTF